MRAHPQARHMRYFSDVQRSPYGKLSLPRLPAAMMAFVPAPRLGEHSRAILAQAGHAAEQIAELIAKGVMRAGEN